MTRAVKRCKRCGETKSLEEFYTDHRGRDGRRASCKACHSAMCCAWSKRNPDRKRIHKRKYLYGITPEEFDDLLKAQREVCAICGKPETRRGPDGRTCLLAVDHDHDNGLVRGLLCHRCNAMIGLAGEEQGVLEKAVKYLQWHKMEARIKAARIVA